MTEYFYEVAYSEYDDEEALIGTGTAYIRSSLKDDAESMKAYIRIEHKKPGAIIELNTVTPINKGQYLQHTTISGKKSWLR